MDYITTEYEAECADAEPAGYALISQEMRDVCNAIAEAYDTAIRRASATILAWAEQLDRDILGEQEA